MKKLNEIDNEQAPPESDENSNPTNEEEEEIDIDKELDEKGFMWMHLLNNKLFCWYRIDYANRGIFTFFLSLYSYKQWKSTNMKTLLSNRRRLTRQSQSWMTRLLCPRQSAIVLLLLWWKRSSNWSFNFLLIWWRRRLRPSLSSVEARRILIMTPNSELWD